MITSDNLRRAQSLIGHAVTYRRSRMPAVVVTVADYRVNFGRLDYLVTDSEGHQQWVRANSIFPIPSQPSAQ